MSHEQVSFDFPPVPQAPSFLRRLLPSNGVTAAIVLALAAYLWLRFSSPAKKAYVMLRPPGCCRARLWEWGAQRGAGSGATRGQLTARRATPLAKTRGLCFFYVLQNHQRDRFPCSQSLARPRCNAPRPSAIPLILSFLRRPRRGPLKSATGPRTSTFSSAARPVPVRTASPQLSRRSSAVYGPPRPIQQQQQYYQQPSGSGRNSPMRPSFGSSRRMAELANGGYASSSGGYREQSAGPEHGRYEPECASSSLFMSVRSADRHRTQATRARLRPTRPQSPPRSAARLPDHLSLVLRPRRTAPPRTQPRH